jgi:hypothetical protein
MKRLKKLYYHFTAYVPRKLPRTEEEYEALCQVLFEQYGIPDSAEVRATIAGQVTSVPGQSIRKPYGHIANFCKRLAMNELAQGQKKKAMDELKKKWALKMEEEAKKNPVTETVEDRPNLEEVTDLEDLPEPA